MGPPALNPGEPPDDRLSALEAQPTNRTAQAKAAHTTERIAPARGGPSLVLLYVRLIGSAC